MEYSPIYMSHGLRNIAEGSDPINEDEEINEVKSLHSLGVRAAKISDFNQALKYFSEALEIDNNDTSVLQARSKVFFEMGDYTAALQDAENIISIKPKRSQGYILQGLAFQRMNMFKEALTSLLMALDLDTDGANKLTNHITRIVTRFCHIPKDMAKSVKAMDAYNKLCEVGVVLYQAGHHDLCVHILETAQKFQTKQKGITLRLLLTLANAHSKLGHRHQALSLYQECLTLAVATHEYMYQSKALVNIATLYLEDNNTHQAIINYRKLLCLESELLVESGSADTMPEYWTKELQCGLHLNLSIAYKTIGSMSEAVLHAHRYVNLVEKYGIGGHLQAESYHNTGMLKEILGELPAAIECYEKYLALAKQNSDMKGIAQAYGCLGAVQAALCNWPLSISYHQQHIAMATKLDEQRMMAVANEMLGDTYMLMQDYEKAVTQYEIVLNSCSSSDYRTKAMTLCKIGRAYRAQGRSQYSLFFFEQAASLADDFDFSDVYTMAEYHQACILCTSTQLSELEQAQKSFSKLIPFFEKKISEHKEENSYCPEEYHTQLAHCYDGMLSVLSSLGNKEECLQYAEAHRKQSITQLPNYHVTCAGHAHYYELHQELWSMEHIHRVVSEQNATVIFYSLLEHCLLLWVLVPGVGLVRFYSGRAPKDMSMRAQIKSLIEECFGVQNQDKNLTKCENRALPLHNANLDHLRKQNLRQINGNNLENNCDGTAEKDKGTFIKKSPQRQLYEILLAPIEDILLKIEEPHHLVIVPDKELHHCPFAALQDWRGIVLSKRFSLCYVPSLLLLDRVIQNEQAVLRLQDDLEFERTQSRKGGLEKILVQESMPEDDFSQDATESFSASIQSQDNDGVNLMSIQSQETASINLKQVSNPRLHTSGNLIASRRSVQEFQPSKSKRMSCSSMTSHSLNREKGSAVPLSKMLSSHAYSTLTTRTWTGTDITASTQGITAFVQLSDRDKFVILGAPSLPDSLIVHGQDWKTGGDLIAAKHELQMVGELVDVGIIIGPDATKQRFLKEIQDASIIHIATHACLQEGILLLTPDPDQSHLGIKDTSHLVTVEDILTCKLRAELVVISGGFSPVRQNVIDSHFRLPSVFLAAGALSVLVCQWQVPDLASEKFFFAFYHHLQNGSKLSSALTAGSTALKNDERFKSLSVWSPFILIGHDSQINILHLRHAMLDQCIDRIETEVEENSGKEILNPKSSIPYVPTRAEKFKLLQQLLVDLLRHHQKQPRIISILIDMLDAALKRLHTQDNNSRTAQLDPEVSGSPTALKLLKHLGFHFQAQGGQLTTPYIVFPHWNTDDLMIPSYDALRAINDLASDPCCVKAISDCLPLSQENISLMIDLMSITKHATEVQLKVIDMSVQPLWQISHIRQLLLTTGFCQIGLLLTFNSTPANKQLLASLLQLLLAVSVQKSPVLLYRLDVSLLGHDSSSKSSLSRGQATLPSLTPLILPRNQLRMSTPWLSTVENKDEMVEKIKLAKSKSNLSETFHKNLERAKTWHQTSVVAQANEVLDEFGRPKTSPTKVKVVSGMTASQQRLPVDHKPVLSLHDIDQRRDYAHHVLQERLHDLDGRYRSSVMKLFLPYIKT